MVTGLSVCCFATSGPHELGREVGDGGICPSLRHLQGLEQIEHDFEAYYKTSTPIIRLFVVAYSWYTFI
jgi:hypothetical protein